MTTNTDLARRQTILEAIRRSLAESAPFDSTPATHEKAKRDRAVEPDCTVDASIERFRTALEGVGGRIVVVADEAAAAEAVREILDAAGARRVALSDSSLVERVMRRASIDGLTLERSPDRAALFGCDAGITGAQWAIAETGTLALDSDRERHRLVSLVPPRHVALVEAGVMRATLAEVLAEAGARGVDGLCRTLTLVTGPSRTSDIELTLAIGVHGPAELYVVVVGGDGHA